MKASHIAKNVIKNMMEIADVKKQSQLADILGIKQPSVSGAIAKGRIPESWFKIIINKFGVTKEDIKKQSEDKAPETTQENVTSDDFRLDNMVSATVRVLQSDTVYRTALASNIRAFDKAVQQENDVEGLKEQMTLMLEKMDSMQEQLNRRDCTRKKRDPETKSQVNSDE